MSDFNEQYKSPHVEPACGQDGLSDFPFDQVCQHVDGEEPEFEQNDHAKAMSVLCMYLDWIMRDSLSDKNSIQRIGMRAIAAIWVVNPNRFGTDRNSQSLDGVAKRLGFSNANLSPLTAEFSRRFGIKNQFQSHDSNSKSHKAEKAVE